MISFLIWLDIWSDSLSLRGCSSDCNVCEDMAMPINKGLVSPITKNRSSVKQFYTKWNIGTLEEWNNGQKHIACDVILIQYSTIALKLHFVPIFPLFQSHDIEVLDRL
jgi:hypothetical protein